MPRSDDSKPGERPPAAGERIAKLLARAGVASRREIERMIADGRVARDGTVLDTPATVLPSLAGVTVDGNPVAAPEPARLFLYHKPVGLLVTERDPNGRPTIYDRLPADLPRVVPVGRLDLNTEGLLLLTTDGGFKRELELPATGVERTYRARAYGRVSQAQLEELIHGVEIDGMRYGSIDANLERRTGANFWIEMTLTEGKNREVRRVLDHLGLEVSRLIRVRYGPFVLADLPPGQVGEVRHADLTAFRHTLGSRRKDDTRIAVQGGAAPRARVSAGSRPSRSQDGHDGSRASQKLHPRAGGGSVAARVPAAGTRPPREDAPTSRSRQGPARASSAPQKGPRLRGEGATAVPGLSPPRPGGKPARPTSARADAAQARTGQAKAAPPKPDAPPANTPRPATIERKPGWARPKPKTGPKTPRKR